MITITNYTDEHAKNWEVANRINRDALINPRSPYVGKCVGVLHGQVVAVASDLTELDGILEAMPEDTSDAAWVEASIDYEKTVYIWRL